MNIIILLPKRRGLGGAGRWCGVEDRARVEDVVGRTRGQPHGLSVAFICPNGPPAGSFFSSEPAAFSERISFSRDIGARPAPSHTHHYHTIPTSPILPTISKSFFTTELRPAATSSGSKPWQLPYVSCPRGASPRRRKIIMASSRRSGPSRRRSIPPSSPRHPTHSHPPYVSSRRRTMPRSRRLPWCTSRARR